MKAKLQTIREALAFYADAEDGECEVLATNGLALIDTLIAELDSSELVDKVAEVLECDLFSRRGFAQVFGDCGDELSREILTTNAQAAISTIRGE